ncbi:MAG TPA: lipopolysaccharide heptosyltransferase I [Pyrinomonadaceae bacterium]|nr:lipopolysaccharide heptosyltransferase I [Pyrinomonadaceae bacterium]
MRVSIVRLSSMGDLVQTLPALTDAARAIPEISFDWIVDESFAQVPSWHSNVQTVIPSAFRRWRKNWRRAFQSGEPQSFLKKVRAQQYDFVVDVQGELKSALATRLARGPRYGYERPAVHEWGAQFAYQKKFFVPKDRHSIQRMRQLLAGALGYEYEEERLDYGIDRSRLGPVPIDLPERFVVFIHSTSWTSKVWPEFYWQDLLNKVTSDGYTVLLPWGDEAELQRATRIAAGNDKAIVLPDLSISQKAAIINRASATVGLDTGLSHIAAALDIPSITIYGATDPLLVGATGKQQLHLASAFECVGCHDVECKYAGPAEFKPACLVEIKPAHVWQKLKHLSPGVVKEVISLGAN